MKVGPRKNSLKKANEIMDRQPTFIEVGVDTQQKGQIRNPKHICRQRIKLDGTIYNARIPGKLQLSFVPG